MFKKILKYEYLFFVLPLLNHFKINIFSKNLYKKYYYKNYIYYYKPLIEISKFYLIIKIIVLKTKIFIIILLFLKINLKKIPIQKNQKKKKKNN